jgi:hypothetical protein
MIDIVCTQTEAGVYKDVLSFFINDEAGLRKYIEECLLKVFSSVEGDLEELYFVLCEDEDEEEFNRKKKELETDIFKLMLHVGSVNVDMEEGEVSVIHHVKVSDKEVRAIHFHNNGVFHGDIVPEEVYPRKGDEVHILYESNYNDEFSVIVKNSEEEMKEYVKEKIQWWDKKYDEKKNIVENLKIYNKTEECDYRGFTNYAVVKGNQVIFYEKFNF